MAAATKTRPDLQKRRSGRMWITLARMVRDAEVGSSNLPHPTSKSPGQRPYLAWSKAIFRLVDPAAIPRVERDQPSCDPRLELGLERTTMNACSAMEARLLC